MKAVAIDLDGTLLNSKHQISSYTKDILNKLHKNGIRIVLASARPIRSVLNIAAEIGLTGLPMIGGNGAIIAKNENEILYRNSISKDDVLKIGELLKEYLSLNPKNEITMHIYSGFKWLIPFHTEKAKEEIKIIGFSPDVIGEDAFKADLAEKIMFVSNPNTLKEFLNILNKNLPHLSSVLSKSDSLEINAVGVSKFLGVQEYANYHKINISNFIAFGDGDNDETMIANCGYGVAMANGTKLAKAHAKFITETNDDDGVAIFLENYFFKSK